MSVRRILPAVAEIREIGEDELERWVELKRSATARTGTVDDYLDWRRQAGATVWLLASSDGADAGVALGVGDWHAPPGVGHGGIYVPADRRRGGVGTALLDGLYRWARDHRYRELLATVQEDDPTSLAWAERRGFVEVRRNSTLALDLERVEAPSIAPPDGIEIVTWADRPDLAPAMYEVAREAYPDVPGQEDDEMASFEDWLSADMQGTSDRPEATFVALADGEVVAYAKLALSSSRPTVAIHDLTGVRRQWRGRGIAGALKRAEIAWAKQAGYTRLETMNEERNEPIRRLNERHGYRQEPGEITVRGTVPAATGGS